MLLTEWLFRSGRTFTTDDFCGPGDLTERCRKCMWCMRHIRAQDFLAEYPPPDELLRHWSREIRIATITRLSGNPATTWNDEIAGMARHIKIKR